MSKEINQEKETRFSASPQKAREASFVGRHLNAEAFVNPERERVFATHDPRAVSTARLATSDPHTVQLGTKDGRDLRVRASSSGLVGDMLFDALIFGSMGATLGLWWSGGNPAAAVVGGAVGGLVGAVVGWVAHRVR